MSVKITKQIDERRAAEVEYDRHGAHLMTCNNGFQWSGAAIYSVEVAEASIEVLQKYVDMMKEVE